jgi:phospholipid-translocating ATPase
LQAASPDEIAIVKWCTEMGLKLIYRDMHSIRLQFESTILSFKILHVFPFSSETKRMGIIVQDITNQEIVFYQKGADSIMMKIVLASDWLEEECANMAREGLRTLVIGRKILSTEQYEVFKRELEYSNVLTQNRDKAVARVIEKHLECELELLGLTGVEDQLQVLF